MSFTPIQPQNYEEFRLYLGYLDEFGEPEHQRLEIVGNEEGCYLSTYTYNTCCAGFLEIFYKPKNRRIDEIGWFSLHFFEANEAHLKRHSELVLRVANTVCRVRGQLFQRYQALWERIKPENWHRQLFQATQLSDQVRRAAEKRRLKIEEECLISLNTPYYGTV